ncbi:MAG TPA: hypothetical protein VG708_09135 [Mycobacteriales bacterium]|nr:hypothetical protein [Mycobacteriales bacterium]
MTDERLPGAGGEHLSLDEIADLDAGLLAPERISQARAHLHGCRQCQARADAITQVRHRLADVSPAMMPTDVAARIDRVLAEERSAGDADGETDPPARPGRESAATVLPLQRLRRLSVPAIAASVVVLLAISAVVVGELRHGSSPANHSAVQAGAANGGSTQYVVSSTGRTYTAASLPADVTELLTGRSNAPDFSTDRKAEAAPSAAPSLRSGSGSGAAAGTRSGGAAAPSVPGSALAPVRPLPKALRTLQQSPRRVLACASFISGSANAVPLAVDFGRWTGGSYHAAPSIILVLPDDATHVGVYVVAPACRSDTSLREYQRVPLAR